MKTECLVPKELKYVFVVSVDILLAMRSTGELSARPSSALVKRLLACVLFDTLFHRESVISKGIKFA